MRWIFISFFWAYTGPLMAAELRVIDANNYHLGTPGFPEWEEFAGKNPHGRRLDLKFEGWVSDSRAGLEAQNLKS